MAELPLALLEDVGGLLRIQRQEVEVLVRLAVRLTLILQSESLGNADAVARCQCVISELYFICKLSFMIP